MKFSPIILAIASAVSATKVTYYTDNSCQSEAVTKEIEFEQCIDLFNAEHPNVRSIQFQEITGADKTTGYWNNPSNQCNRDTVPHTFEVGKCEKIVSETKYELLKPEGDGQIFFKNGEECGPPDESVTFTVDSECHNLESAWGEPGVIKYFRFWAHTKIAGKAHFYSEPNCAGNSSAVAALDRSECDQSIIQFGRNLHLSYNIVLYEDE